MVSLSDIYKPEALDTRFIPPLAKQKAAISKSYLKPWSTLKRQAYGFVCITTILFMFYVGIQACSTINPAFSQYQPLLSKGWMGPTVDDTDQQYHGFRSNFILLTVAMLAHTFGRRLLGCNTGQKRTVFDFIVGIGQTLVLHGTSAFKIFIILALNFLIVRTFKNRTICWAFCILTLFSNEIFHGYNYLNQSKGILEQWEVLFKCTVLRMISYDVDYIEMVEGLKINTKDLTDEDKRVKIPRDKFEYSFPKYLGYSLYLPLYLAGPIVTFNDFREQVHRRLPSIQIKRVLVYAFRFVNCMLCMEFILHYIPAPAVTQVKAWKGLTPAQVSMIAWFNLVIIWLKLLIPWRMFRLWSMMDGIDPPENMVRCVANNYSPSLFWRSWHRSFNLFMLRYLYFPLGGSNKRIINSLLVFAFTALWHDIRLRLFVWGFLAVGFVIPEILARTLVPECKYKHTWWYYHVSAMGGMLNIWMLLIANLVGFAVGTDGIIQLLSEMGSTANGLKFVIFASFMLYIGVQIMYEVRQSELRRGLDLKC